MPLITLSRFDQGSLGHVACFWEGNGGKLQLASERQATSSKDSELFLIITGSNGLAQRRSSGRKTLVNIDAYLTYSTLFNRCSPNRPFGRTRPYRFHLSERF